MTQLRQRLKATRDLVLGAPPSAPPEGTCVIVPDEVVAAAAVQARLTAYYESDAYPKELPRGDELLRPAVAATPYPVGGV
jgi:hypothetical protein